MCGIAGFVDFSGRPASMWEPALDRMLRAIDHRGPDGWGRMVLDGATMRVAGPRGETTRERPAGRGPTVGLAHRRLAIIDLSSGGDQPMAAASGAGWLTYNGEIYNYHALRQSLTGRGVALRTASDTEALVELLDRDGVDAIGQLRGMFAFAWWDERAGRLLLARDRLGIKPVVYAQPEPGLWLFASDARALLASGCLDAHPAFLREGEFLTRGSIPTTSSFWADVEAVAPGEWVSVVPPRVTRHAYWSLGDVLLTPTPNVPVESVARVAHRAIVSSVEAHLVSDVPVAIFLSGGLDSTAILAAARAVTTGPLQTFTVIMPGSRLDESARARAIAAHFGSEHAVLSIDGVDIDEALEEFFAAMDRPSVDGFNTFLVARAARQAGVRVALSGVGGDEVFGGYPSFSEVPRLQQALAWSGPVGRWCAPLLARVPSSRATKLGVILAAGPRSTADVWWEYRRLFSAPDIEGLTGESGAAAPAVPAGAVSPFDLVRYMEHRHFLEPQLLCDADAFTMCGALELRTPLVDHLLLEDVVRAGRWPRRAGLSFKQTLFHAMPALTWRGGGDQPKLGFELPFDVWLRAAFTDKSPRQMRDVASRLMPPKYRPFVARFLDRRLHWSRVWALYVLDRMSAP